MHKTAQPGLVPVDSGRLVHPVDSSLGVVHMKLAHESFYTVFTILSLF